MGWGTRMFQVYTKQEEERIWYRPGDDFPCNYLRTVELEFETSWDWIMPVVEKIESMGYFVMINKWTSVYTGTENNRIEVTTVSGKNKLQNTVKAIDIFIRQIVEP